MPRAAIWDICARAASGSMSRELFDAAASDSEKSLIDLAHICGFDSQTFYVQPRFFLSHHAEGQPPL